MSKFLTKEELFNLHNTYCKTAFDIMKQKNADYSHGSDPFSNFRGSEFIGIKPELGILMRSMDKFKRIQAFIEAGTLQVKSESVEDAILDVINYMILLAGMIEEKNIQTDAKSVRVLNVFCSICKEEIGAGEELVTSFNDVGLLFDHIGCYDSAILKKSEG